MDKSTIHGSENKYVNTQELYVGVNLIVKLYVIVFYHISKPKKRVENTTRSAAYSDELRTRGTPLIKDGDARRLVVPFRG